MNKPTSKPVLIAAFASIVVGAGVTLVVVGILFYPRQNSVSADSSVPQVLAVSTGVSAPDDGMVPPPPPLPAVSPITIPASIPVSRPVAPVPVAAVVKPVPPATPGLPAICQSQSYTPEREAQCPHSAPVPTATPISTPALDSPVATPSPAPQATTGS